MPLTLFHARTRPAHARAHAHVYECTFSPNAHTLASCLMYTRALCPKFHAFYLQQQACTFVDNLEVHMQSPPCSYAQKQILSLSSATPTLTVSLVCHRLRRRVLVRELCPKTSSFLTQRVPGGAPSRAGQTHLPDEGHEEELQTGETGHGILSHFTSLDSIVDNITS